MQNNNNQSFLSLKHQCEDSNFEGQLQRTIKGFMNSPCTMKELSVVTGIDRANLCRYVRHLRLKGEIVVYKKVYCSITRHRANAHTTNPKLFPKTIQLTLF